jgi:hypothetical protein
VILVLAGGFVVSLGSLRVSSRNPRTPLLLAIVGLLAATVVSRVLEEPPPWVELLARLRRSLPPLHFHERQLWIHGRLNLPAAIPIALVIAAAIWIYINCSERRRCGWTRK